MGFPRARHEGEKSEILCRSRIQSSGNFYFYEFHEHPQWFACRDRANLRPACVQFSLSHRANKRVNFFLSSFFLSFSHFHIFAREEIDRGAINDEPVFFFYQKCRIFFHIAALMHAVLHPSRHINFYIFRSVPLKRRSRFVLAETIGRKLAISRRFAALLALS